MELNEIVNRVKSGLLDRLPPPMYAYLRQERPTWTKQVKRNSRALSTAYRARAFDQAMRAPIAPRTVLWESFSGNGALCNPEALFRAMIDDPRFSEFTHTWVLAGGARDSAFAEEFKGHRRVSFVRYRSVRYYRLLETSRYLVNNATFPAEFIKRPGQTYLNTWHGTPLKKMGYDIEGGAEDARNVMRNFLSADFLLSQNAFMTEQMYLEAYRLRNAYEGAIIEEGYPRSDHMFGADAGARARAVLRERGIETQGRRVLVYAPTWRGESFYQPSADAVRLKETIRRLRETAELRGWTVLLKAHQVVVDQLADDPETADFLIPNDVPANEALALADLLVSDYSSIFVDYLATGRPLAFHIPDVAGYAHSRGLYLRPEELPGPVSQTLDELVANVVALVSEDGPAARFPAEAARYAELAARYTADDDGGASARVLDIVFGGRETGHRVRRDFKDGRTKLALYLGGLITNGITSAALNLLSSLDPETYDVTVLYYRPTNADRRANAAKIPAHVRQVIRDQGLLQLSLVASTSALAELPEDADAAALDSEVWTWEWQRLFGQTRFDAAVDFSGYSPYWARIIAHGTAARKAIWLHNDLQADALREVNGERPHFENLTGVFRLYGAFDALVSVSPDLTRINADSLAAHADAEKFVSARNPIDAERVLRGAGVPVPSADAQSPDGPRADTAAAIGRAAQAGELGAAVTALGEAFSFEAVLAEVQRQASAADLVRSGEKVFVTVGRLSPEKNHERLLRAFAQVHAEAQDTRLVIIGGGPLGTELAALAGSLGIARAVTFTGVLSNPYGVMAESDCFVMSSDYEGQPIVILEARVLGLPVLTTRFGSAESAMEGSDGLIVECSADALAEGMRAYLRGEIGARRLDPAQYNAEVVEEFRRAVLG